MKKKLKRTYFKLVIDEELESHWKLGEDPEDALFRFQIEVLKDLINPRVFRVKKPVEKLSKER